ncbi:MarR family winged helix-turn-helix transcriptional regulator [Streptomyces sp. NPDC058657]|uniref:MarR family winged helix-turn-helix transcriptional regulator n=1 Tax=unclassified Streptomyces TaxID=2593676 RepID=UPI00364D8BCA
MRSTDPTAGHPSAGEAAAVARAVVEGLEMLWERGREAVPSAPVSTSQLRVLYILDQRDGTNLRRLGEKLGAAPSSVSRLCDRLQALGYVDRSFGSSDRREVQVGITGPGRDYLAELRAHRERELAATLEAMTKEERDALALGLRAFRRANDAADSRPTPGPRANGAPGERHEAEQRPPAVFPVRGERDEASVETVRSA